MLKRVLFFTAVVVAGTAVFVPRFAHAASHLPAPILQCTKELSTAFTNQEHTETPMDVSVYSNAYRQCFVQNGGEALLPVNTGVGYKDFGGASCLVAAEIEYLAGNKTATDEKVFQLAVATCYKENKPPAEALDTSPVQLHFVTSSSKSLMQGLREASPELIACLQKNVATLTTTPTAEQDRAIGKCFTDAGMADTALGYTNFASMLDCAHETSGVSSFSEFTSLTPQQITYYQHCVLSRVVVPGATVAAAAAVPLAVGIPNFLLYIQFLFTQPAMFFIRRKTSRGKVIDSITTAPLDLSTVRLLALPERKTIKTIVTGSTGDYIFVPPPGEYALEVRRHDYVFPSTYGTVAAEYYRGGSISIKKSDEVVNVLVPLDRSLITVSHLRFWFTKWRRTIALGISIVAPILSLFAFIVVPHVWTGLAAAVQTLIFVSLFSITRKSGERPYGVVKTATGSALTGVVVSLFDTQYHKLLYYHITDIFGRYVLPEVRGSFTVTFSKNGYVTASQTVQFAPGESMRLPDVALAMQEKK